MAKDDSSPSRKRRKLTTEQKWIREFLEFYGTDNVTRFCQADLSGVPLLRVVEALALGDQVASEKCDGPGTVCTFAHESEDDHVEATVWFAAGTMELEIKGARRVRETASEPNAA